MERGGEHLCIRASAGLTARRSAFDRSLPLCHPEPVTSPLCASPGRLESARNRAYFIELLRGWKDFNIHKAVDGSRHTANKTLGKR